MKLTDQLDKIIKTDNGYAFTLNGVYQLYASATLLVYYTYASQFLYETIHGNESEVEDFTKSIYDRLKVYKTPTDLESNFVSDYEYFVN